MRWMERVPPQRLVSSTDARVSSAPMAGRYRTLVVGPAQWASLAHQPHARLSASGGKFRVAGHTTVDEDRLPSDVVGKIRREENTCAMLASPLRARPRRSRQTLLQVILDTDLLHRALSFAISRSCASSLFAAYWRTMRSSGASLTRFSGSGRSSVVSQKESVWAAILSSVQPGVIRGASARRMFRVRLPDHRDVPQRELPIGTPEVEVVEAPRLLEDGRVPLGSRSVGLVQTFLHDRARH